VSNHFKITKEQFSSIRDDAPWEQFIREFEIDKILGQFGKDHFDRVLELGCGSGRASQHLAYYFPGLMITKWT
jgi:trans-aconitate methyltransferase